MSTLFIHSVYFRMHGALSAEQKAAFEVGLEKLGTIPVIRNFYYGTPAGTGREVVDNDYDYAWIVHFGSAADHDIYQDHPIHLEFIDKYGDLWKEVKVFDVVAGEKD
ncbi:MAG: Dabb family protein [Bacteroidota bacterium]